MSRRRKRRGVEVLGNEKLDAELTPEDHVCEQLREIQWQTNCSTKSLQIFLNALRGKLGNYVRHMKVEELPKTVKHADKKMQHMVCRNLYFCSLHTFVTIFDMHTHTQAGASRVYLHGCVGPCKKKVWGPEDNSDVCEFCGTSRFKRNGKPKEFIVHFPLKERFARLLQCAQYVEAVRWESARSRRRNPHYMTG